jgi:hypothetical protein
MNIEDKKFTPPIKQINYKDLILNFQIKSIKKKVKRFRLYRL